MAEQSWPQRIGRYEVLGLLGAGGMAEVLLCRLTGQSGFERLVALKRVLPTLAKQPGFTSMFLDEARIVASIHHPNVVQVYELLDEGGELCIVMEYLEGESLAALRKQLPAKGEGLDPALACWVVAEAAAGLHAAHQLKGPDGAPLEVVHRDLSPQNIFLTYEGAVKLLDFGVARARGRLTRTESGTIKGKYEYMSPEQATGRELDGRSDVFSLGIVLWELLTGRRLFRRPSVLAVARAVAEEPVMAPSRVSPRVPAALDVICLKALARPLDQRYASAADLRRDLLTVSRSLGEGAGPDVLGPLLKERFKERYAEKHEMVRKARAGASHVTVNPEPVLLEDDSPVAKATATSESGKRRSHLPAWAGAAAGTVAMGLSAFALWPRPPTPAPPQLAGVPDEPVTPDSPPVVAEPAPEPAPLPPPATDIRLQVETQPPGAQVLLDGRPVGVSPLDVRVPRAERPVQVVVKKLGFLEQSSRLVPDVDQKLTLKLSAARKASGKGPKGKDPLDEKW